MQQLRNTGILHGDLLCVLVPINITVCGKHVLKCVLSLVFVCKGQRVRAELIGYRSAFVWNLDKQISIPISHRVHVQANIQNDKKYVNLDVNARALSTQASRLLPNWQQRWVVTRPESSYRKKQFLFASWKKDLEHVLNLPNLFIQNPLLEKKKTDLKIQILLLIQFSFCN